MTGRRRCDSALVCAVVWVLAASAAGDVAFTASDVAVEFDFDDFRGAGFAPRPAPGALDSMAIIVTGLSDDAGSPMRFGDTRTGGDHARGTSTGGETIGGVYAFDVANGGTPDPALGVQPIAADFTPGRFLFRVRNDTGTAILAIVTSFRIYCRDDEGRSNRLLWEHSLDGVAFTGFAADSVVSPVGPDPSPTWVLARETSVAARFDPGIPPGAFYYFAFSSDDIAGSGSRDEFAIDDVRFVATIPQPATVGMVLLGALCLRTRGSRLRMDMAEDQGV